MAETKVLIIIVTFNGRQFIDNCLSPIYDSSPLIDIMIIDNGSEDDTVNYIKSRYSHVKLIETGKNLGFGGANNIGMSYAIGNGFDFVYLLNQDAWIDYQDILALIETAEKYKNYGIISPFHVYKDKKSIDKGFSRCFSETLINDMKEKPENFKEIYEIKPKGMIQAAHWLLRVEAIKQTGGFSPTFFHYGEDGNLCYRMRYRGWELGVVPGIKGVHDRENRINSDKKRRYLYRQTWKNHMSNPNNFFHSKLYNVRKSMRKSLKEYGIKMIPEIIKFIFEIKKTCKNYKLSYREGSFLKSDPDNK